jgi:hypothetical protein
MLASAPVVFRDPVPIGLLPDCWQFLDEMQSWPAPLPLPADVPALHDDLKHDDDRRLTGLHCISRVAGALQLSAE